MKAPLHMDSPMSEWDAEAKRLGIASGSTYREQVLLADEIIMEIIVEEQRRERMQKANRIARARLAAVLSGGAA
jgi:activator of 2-hydroxyglutaryl-CoA dehydratase